MAAESESTPGSQPRKSRYDVIVVGAGPNGLAAAITLARVGASVLVIEATNRIGGGLRSVASTLPGFVHDHCATIHALAMASPFFQQTPLEDFGVQWIHPDAPAAHPLDDGTAAMTELSLDATCEGLGSDSRAYRRLMEPLVAGGASILRQNLGPFRPPRSPLLMARFGIRGVQSALGLARRWFREPPARAMFAGMAAHSVLPLDWKLTAAVGLMLLMTAHRGGWPIAAGGSQTIADALGRYLVSIGGEIVTGWRIESLDRLPEAKAVMFDLPPRLVNQVAGQRFPAGFRNQLDRFRHGPGAFKVDWALDGPIPWRAPPCRRAGTVHLGGTMDEVAESECASWNGETHGRPFVLLAQQSLIDPSRAPEGKHTGWAYCHVPNGSDQDMTEQIEAQVERFAPGFRALILARRVTTPADFEGFNANLIGGDVGGGAMDLKQLFTRPSNRWSPYTTPVRELFLCSASTPPGGGVHGMCGWHAAQAVIRRALRK